VTQIHLVDDPRFDHARLRKHAVDLTPAPLVQQVFCWLENEEPDFLPPRRALDPCAGAGVFGMEMKSFWPSCTRVGVEIREEEEENLEHNYDVHMVADAERALDGPAIRALAPFDLIATNPAFAISRSLVRKCMRLLTPERGLLLLYQANDFGSRGPRSNALFRDHPPFLQLCIPGAVTHRTGINPKTGKKYGQDQRSYSWWCWKTDHTGETWTARNLPRLPGTCRRWVTRPGEEWRRSVT